MCCSTKSKYMKERWRSLLKKNEEARRGTNQWLTRLSMGMRKEPHNTLLEVSLNITLTFIHLVHRWKSCIWHALCWVIEKCQMTWSFQSKWSSKFCWLKPNKTEMSRYSTESWVLLISTVGIECSGVPPPTTVRERWGRRLKRAESEMGLEDEKAFSRHSQG